MDPFINHGWLQSESDPILLFFLFLGNSEFLPRSPALRVFSNVLSCNTGSSTWHWTRRNHQARAKKRSPIDNNSTAPLEEKRCCTAVSQASELKGHTSHRMDLAISAVRGKMTRALEEGTLLGDDAFLRDVASARAIFKDLDTQGRSLTPQEVSALPCYPPSWGGVRSSCMVSTSLPTLVHGRFFASSGGCWASLSSQLNTPRCCCCIPLCPEI